MKKKPKAKKPKVTKMWLVKSEKSLYSGMIYKSKSLAKRCSDFYKSEIVRIEMKVIK